MSTSPVSSFMDAFFQGLEQTFGVQVWLKQPFENDWLSPCIDSIDKAAGQVSWRPHKRSERANFAELEAALAFDFHEDIKSFYGEYFAAQLPMYFGELSLDLIQAWNEQDFSLLLENITGHVLMQQRLKQPMTVFIASVEDDMQVISLDNQSGEVILEHLGKGRVRVLAPNLDVFLRELKPMSYL